MFACSARGQICFMSENMSRTVEVASTDKHKHQYVPSVILLPEDQNKMGTMWDKCKPSPTHQNVFSLVVLKVVKVFPGNASIAKNSCESEPYIIFRCLSLTSFQSTHY